MWVQIFVVAADIRWMGDANRAGRKRLVVVWDAPNIPIAVGTSLSTLPNGIERLSLDRVVEWLANRAAQRRLVLDATMFFNVPKHHIDELRHAVQAVRSTGFGVYARPKLSASDDVDDAMVTRIRNAVATSNVGEVIVASHDRRAFAPVLADVAAKGVPAFVLGHRQFATWVDAAVGVSFISLQSVADCFRERLTRVDLEYLPDEGTFLPPLKVVPAGATGVALVVRALEELIRESGSEWVRKARLHPKLKLLDPCFTPEAYGYSKLDTMLAACGELVRTRQAAGDHELALVNGTPRP